MKNIRLTTLLILAIAFLVYTAKSAPGDLDTAFSGDGKLTMQIGIGDSFGRATALQSDGKILVAGEAQQGKNTVFCIARYNSDGSLDTSFDGDGKVFTDFDFGTSDFARGILIQSDGKIVVVGSSIRSSLEAAFAVSRYNADGSLDITFDGDGRATTAGVPNTLMIASGVAIQADGRIVVCGRFFNGQGDFALARYNTDGTLDAAFGTAGIVTTDLFALGDEATGIAIQTDGKIVLAGNTNVVGTAQIGLARYNTDGTLDTTFDLDGKLFTGHGGSGIGAFASASSVALQSDGKIVIGGFGGTTPQFVIVRLNSNGSVDGTVRTTILGGANIGRSVKIQPDGKIVLGGSTTSFGSGAENFACIRFNTDLSLDLSFSFDGKAATDFNSSNDIPAGLAIQTDGKIVLAGEHFEGVNRKFAMLRYAADGTEDNSFDLDGLRTDNFGIAESVINAVAVQTDGKIIGAGFQKGAFSTDFLVVRFNPDGTLDTTFDVDGIVTTDFALNNEDKATSITLQADGKILVGGFNTSTLNCLAARYNSDGSLDTTFDGDGKFASGIIGGNPGGINAIAVQADGKVILAGFGQGNTSSTQNVLLFRLSSDGGLEALIETDIFNGNGVANSIALQSDGKVLIASNGVAGSNQDFAIVRYNTNLTLDTTFSGDGVAVVDFGPGDDLAKSVAVQSDGKIVAAGSASNGTNTDFGVARLDSNGVLDSSFSGDGRNTTAIGSGNDVANSVRVQPDGKIILGGFGLIGSSNDFATVRYNANGTLDSTLLWGTGGIAAADLGSDDKINSIAIQADGKVVAAGESGGNVAIARYVGLGPSAASVSVSGRVLTSDGRGISKVRVTITDSGGLTRTAMTGSFGYYRFDSIESGETYLLTVQSKRFTFASPTKIISATDDLTDVDFISNE